MKRRIAFLVVIVLVLSTVLGFTMPEARKVSAAPNFQKVDFVDGEVTANALNVRQGPSTKYPVVCTLKKGQKVKVFGKIGDWYAIYELSGGCVGAAHSKYIKVAGTATPKTTTPKTTTPKTTTPKTSTPAPSTPAQPTPEQKTQTPSTTEQQTGLEDLSQDELEILNLVNEARKKAGANPLQVDKDLMKVARLKAKDMVENNYFAHQSPTYGSPFDMMKTFGISFKSAGENIAGNRTAKGAFDAWMKSEGHKKNILNPNFTHTGIGVYDSPTYGKVFVQMFIQK